MFNPFNQYQTWRDGGFTVFGALMFTLLGIILAPYIWYKIWRIPKSEDFGSFDELKAQRDEHGIVRRKNEQRTN